jgi:hypothetical protein
MSDLDTGTPESPGTGSSAGWRHETAEPASGHRRESLAGTDDYGEHEETQGGTEARIAMQDELPSPAQSQAATWGDSPEYYDETELAGTYDGDLGAFLAAGDDLPTPQESRARTWGDNPEYYDETSLASGHDEDPGTPAAPDHGPAAPHAPARPEAQDTDAESAGTAMAPADVAGTRLKNIGRPPDAGDDPPQLPGTDRGAANDSRDLIIQARDTTIANRDATIAQRDMTIEELREAAEAKDRQIAELNQVLSGRNDLIEEQRQDLSAKDSENENLKSENAGLKIEIWQLEDQREQPEAQPASRIANRDIPPSQEAERQPKPERTWWQRLPSDTTTTAVVGYTGVATAIATAAQYMSGVEAGITAAVAGAIAATIGVVNERRKKGKNGD